IRFTGNGHEKPSLLKEITERTQRLYGAADTRNATPEQWIDLHAAVKDMGKETLQANQLERTEAMEMLQYHLLLSIYSYASQELLWEDPQHQEIHRIYHQKYLENFSLQQELVHSDYIEINHYIHLAIRQVIMHDAISDGVPYDKKYLKYPVKMYASLQREYAGHPLKNIVLSGFINHLAKVNGWNDTIEILAQRFCNETIEADPYRLQIETLRQEMLSNLSQDALACNFALQDTAGNVRKLEEFMGKVVLIDFMTYACAGCYALVPRLQALEHEFAGEDVAFISISADKTKERFKKGIGRFSSPSALALYTNGEGTSHEVIRRYGVQLYPTLVLIDKEGKIIESRAPKLKSVEEGNRLREMIRNAL
ncbi:MAG: TlpA family protein disulfide reductase, partial [Cyclobacteriaceae bacterium]